MVIYIDQFLISEFILSFSTFLLLNIITHNRIVIKRLVLASLLITILSFFEIILKLNHITVSPFVIILYFVFSVTLGILISSGKYQIKYLLKNVFMLIGIMFFETGTVLIIIGFFRFGKIKLFQTTNSWLVSLVLFGVNIILILVWFNLKRKIDIEQLIVTLELYENDMISDKFSIEGFVDSGNKLKTSLGEPVIILSKNMKSRIGNLLYSQLCFEVYTVAGKKSLVGGYIERISIVDRKRRISIEKVAVCFSEEVTFYGDTNAIIPEELLK